MAESKKISTLVLIVDLDCCRCYKKIKKVLAKFCEIQNQNFDEKQNKVTISGPFDPEKLKRKLWCKAGKCITDIQIPPTPTKKPPPKQEPEPEPKLSVPGIPVGPYGPMGCCSCKPRCKCHVEQGICSCKRPDPKVCSKPCGECHVEQGICSCKQPDPKVCCKPCGECHVEQGICSCKRPYPKVCCTDCYEGDGQHGICKQVSYESGCKLIFTEVEDNSNCRLM